MDLSPKQLDEQSSVQLDGWLEMDSEKWREADDNPNLTRKWLRMLLGNALFVDKLGRVWGASKENNEYYPFHIESGSKKFGIRISQLAAN